MMPSQFARAAASLKDMWFATSIGGKARFAVVARPVNDDTFIASVIFEVLPEFEFNDAAMLEIISQLERLEHI